MTLQITTPLVWTLITAATLQATVAQSEPLPWGQFRGPDGSGVTQQTIDLTKVGKKQNLLWKTPVRGVGWSSTVTDGESLFLTTSVTSAATAEEKQKALSKVQMSAMKDVAGTVELIAVALDAQTGTMRWEKSLETVSEPKPIHPMNSYASPTPLVAGDRVIFHFGGYGTWCLDSATGETIWQQRLAVDDSVGPGSSPIISDELMLVACDGIDQQFVVALSIDDGSIAWKTPRPPIRATNPEFQKAYSTPLLIEVAGKRQAVIPGAQWLVAYDPASGQEIWRADCGDGFSNTAMPLFHSGLIWFSNGYTSAELIAIDPTGKGDVSKTHIRMRQSRNVPIKPSLVADDENLYLISDSGILSACDQQTAQGIWRERVGGTFSASPIRSGGQILIANHDGDLIVFETGNKYSELSKTEFGEQVMATPMPFANDIILRTKQAVYRYSSAP